MGIKQTKTKSNIEDKRISYKDLLPIEKRLEIIANECQKPVKLIVGGQIFYISRETITKSYFDSYFKKLDLQKDEFFIDRSFDDFEVVLEMLRQSCLITYSGKEDIIKTQHSICTSINNKEIFMEDLKFYFGKELPRIEKIFGLASLVIKDCNGYIDKFELAHPVKDQKLEYMFYTAKDIKDLYSTNSRKAFFIENDGALIINLTVKTTLDKIEIRPFIFDLEYYNHLQCYGIFIYGSVDRSNWTYIAKTKFSPQNDWIATVYLHSLTMKYIKITTDKYNCPLSISYIKLLN
jgi:hypothetical protein